MNFPLLKIKVLQIVFLVFLLGMSIPQAHASQTALDRCYNLTDLNLADINQVYQAFNDDIMSIEAVYNNLDMLVSASKGCLVIDGNQNKQDLWNLINFWTYLSADRDMKLYISGIVRTSGAIKLHTGTDIEGDPDTPNSQIMTIKRPVWVLLFIDDGYRDISIRNLILKENQVIKTAFIHLAGNNENIAINWVEIKGRNPEDRSLQTNGVYLYQKSMKNISIRNSQFSWVQYWIHSQAHIEDVSFNDNEFTTWSRSAIFISRGSSTPRGQSKNIYIKWNYFHDPVISDDNWVIKIFGGRSVSFVKNVTVSRNRIHSPWVPHSLDLQTNGTADQIILHNVHTFLIADNEVRDGWENGITVSNLSRQWTIVRNIVSWHDGHGMNIWSWAYEIKVDDGSLFLKWQTIQGNTRGGIGLVKSVEGNIVSFSTVIGGIFFPGETLNIVEVDPKKKSIVRNVLKSNIAKVEIIDRTKYVRVLDNIIYDNGVDKRNDVLKLSGINIANSDTIELQRNQIYNSKYGNVPNINLGQFFSINLSNSRNIYISEDNVFEKWNTNFKSTVNTSKSSWYNPDSPLSE